MRLHNPASEQLAATLLLSLAHEVNNFLSIVSGNTQLLEASGPNTLQSRPLERLSDSVKVGAELTTRLSDFAKLLEEPVCAFPAIALLNQLRANVDLAMIDIDPSLHVAIRAEQLLIMVDAMVDWQNVVDTGACVHCRGNTELEEAQAAEFGMQPGPVLQLSVGSMGTLDTCKPLSTHREAGRRMPTGVACASILAASLGGALVTDTQTRGVMLVLPAAKS